MGRTLRAALLAAALLGLTGSAAQAAGWSVVLKQSHSSYASGIACPRYDWCVLVGGHRLSTQQAAKRNVAGLGTYPAPATATTWNGHAWARQSLPEPRRAEYLELGPVSCLAGRAGPKAFCMAVGTVKVKHKPAYPIAERLSSGHWRAQILPGPGVSHFRQPSLSAISCASTRLCVAVGEESFPAMPFSPLMERYNGRRWIGSRPSGTSDISGVSCPTTSFCLATGDVITKVGELSTSYATAPVTLTWSGTQWSTASPSQDWMVGDDCLTASMCLGVGAETAFTVESDNSVSEREAAASQTWNDGSWGSSFAFGPLTQNSKLNQVSCAAVASCLAIGRANGLGRSMAARLTSTGWTSETVPSHVSLAAVSCSPRGKCRVAGTARSGPVVLRYRS